MLSNQGGDNSQRLRLIFRNVNANRARCPNLPFFFAAARNLDAGIGFPFFAPNARRKEPFFCG